MLMKKSFILSLFLASFLLPFAAHAEDEVEKIRSRCQGNEALRTAYDCECIISAFKEAWSGNVSSSSLQVYGNVMSVSGAKCLQPEKIYANALGNCGRSYSLYKQHDKANLGKTKFCQCVADETVKSAKQMNHHRVVQLVKPTMHGFDICGQKKSYDVSGEASAPPAEEQASVATLPAGETISATEDATYLIILNKNFDLNRLDPVKFAMSDDYKPHLNLKYVTPKNHAVTTLPQALIKRGAVPPGVITSRSSEDVPTMAEMYNQAILVKGSGLKEMQHEIKRVRAVTSVDYYKFSGDEIYLVPDLPSRL